MIHKHSPILPILICLALVLLSACEGKAIPPSPLPLIAFSNASSSGKSVIYTMNPDSSGKIALTDGESNDHGPLWSPDGNFFGISSNLDKNFKPENWRTWLVSLDGATQVDITAEAGIRPVNWKP